MTAINITEMKNDNAKAHDGIGYYLSYRGSQIYLKHCHSLTAM